MDENDDTSTTETGAPEASAEESTSDDPRLAKARKDAAGYRTKLRDAEKELEEFRKAAQDKADADKSETEKRTAAEKRADAAELRALRLEVAAEKGLTAAQAKRLVGATREELEADADEVLQLFPGSKAPKAPKPDPSQGNRGGKPSSGRDAAMAEIQKRFGTKSTAT